ncbi:MAG: HNH endonuclease [Brachybacterium sp.]|nr:HNH endonuclease [Brachybacterium sp.]
MTIVPLAPSGPGTDRLDRPGAETLGERIQQQAAVIAAATCELLLLIGQFDARSAVGWFVGFKSTAHWLSWSCSMAPGTAREHVRVARALPSMPRTVAEFRAGRLSYSKVREMTRVADRVDEQVLVEMARAMTAAQLSRTIAGFHAADGSRLGQDAVRRAEWFTREDGMVEIRAVLPTEIGSELVTALELAMDRDGSAPPRFEHPSSSRAVPDESEEGSGPAADHSIADRSDVERAAEVTTEAALEQRRADALHGLARTFLASEPDDRSGEDRHLVIVQVSAEALAQNVPAGTPRPSAHDVPAGTTPRCGVLGAGPLEVTTAERLACTGQVSLVLTDAGGEVLHLGRKQRLASRAQRRALRLRDATCTFPGCHQARHLDAHHLLPWSEGGLTDIEGLALLCRRHHVMVHEGGLRVVRDPSRSSHHRPRLQVLDRTGRPVQARWPAMLEHLRISGQAGEAPAAPAGAPTAEAQSGEMPPRGPAPGPIGVAGDGTGFSLIDCVDALCQNVIDHVGRSAGRAGAA